ncbi:MAG TPA: HEAT repeat domain-containing protein [Planctomycetota bacterium]
MNATSSTRWSATLAAAALLAAAATWFVFRDGRLGDPPPAATTALELQWRAEDQLAYLLQIDSQVAFGADPERVPYRLRARLCLRVLAAGSGGADAAVQLRDVDYLFGTDRQPARQAALGAAFVVHFEGGVPARFQFPPPLAPEIQDQLREVLRTFQATSPPASADGWSVVEEDANGPFRASYVRDPSGAWHRQKVAYLTDAEAKTPLGRVAVLASAADLRPAEAHSWWQAAEVREELEVRSSGIVSARVATHATLVPAAWDATCELARPQLEVDTLLRQPVAAIEPAQAPAVATRPMTPADQAALRELLAAYTAAGGRDSSFVRRIAALLREVPELAIELHPVLIDPGQLGTVAAGVAHALELAGTRESQFVLATIGGDAAVPAAQRQRAIIALGGVLAPEPDSVELLRQIGQGTGDAGATETAHAALLALGSMGRKLSASDSESYAAVCADLGQMAVRHPDPHRRAVALRALANTGDKWNAAVAAEALLDTSPVVRAAAVGTLALLDDAPTLDLLTERVGADPDGRVRAAIGNAMRGMSTTSPATFAACARQLGHEPHADARGALACYLADHLADYPEGRPALEALLQRETRRDTVRYVAGRVHRTPRQ